MVPLHSDRDLRIWWSMNTQNEQMDLLFYGHRATANEAGTSSLVSFFFSRRNNRGPPPEEPQSDDDGSDNGMNPESSTTAAERAPKNSMKKRGTVERSGLADVNVPVSDDDGFSVVGTDLVSTAIQASPPNSMLSPGKQSYPHANLNSGALRPSQQTRRETNIKEVSGLATCTHVAEC